MEAIWNLLSSRDSLEKTAISVLELLKTAGFSNCNCMELMDRLLQMGHSDPWRNYLFPTFTFPILHTLVTASGSWSEDVNIGQNALEEGLIAELDFMFTIGIVNKKGPLILEPTAHAGFYLVRVHYPTMVSKNFLEMLCTRLSTGYYLSPAKTVKHVNQVVRKTFTNCEIKKQAANEENLNCPVVTLRFINIPKLASQERSQTLMLDVAPVLQTELKVNKVKLPFLSETQRNNVLSQPVLLVAKYKSDKLQWRASTSMSERQIFTYLRQNYVVKYVLKQAKLIKSLWLTGETGIKSYFLKTTLLHWLSEANSRSEWNIENLSDYVVELFDRLRCYIEQGNLPHFFNKDINLLAEIDLCSDSITEFRLKVKDKVNFAKSIVSMNSLNNYMRLVYDDHEDEFEFLKNVSDTQKMKTTDHLQMRNKTSKIMKKYEDPLLLNASETLESVCLQFNSESLSTYQLNKLMLFAVLNHNMELMEALLKEQSSRGLPCMLIEALCIAAEQGFTDIIQLLIHNNVNVNERYKGCLPLNLAVEQRHLSAVTLLLQSKADLNARDDEENTALNIAVCLGDAKITALLLSFKADPNVSYCNELRCIHVACMSVNVEIVTLLLQHGAIVNCSLRDTIFDDNVCTLPSPLLLAIGFYDKTVQQISDEETRRNLIEMLLKNGATVNSIHCGDFALKNAVYNGFLTIVELLLQYGADINCLDCNGHTALLTASLLGFTDIVQLLITNGADVNKVDFKGLSPIMAASLLGHTDIVRLLAQCNANIRAFDHINCNALSLAARGGYTAVIETLIEYGALDGVSDCVVALELAINQNHVNAVRLLLRYFPILNDRKYLNILPKAASQGCYEIVELLIKAGLSVNIEDTGKGTALLYATLRGYLNVIKLLVRYGANVNQAPTGTSALHLASINGHIDVARYLIENGAEVNYARKSDNHMIAVGNDEGNSLSLAVKGGKYDYVKMLLELCDGKHGNQRVDINFQASDGTTPLIDAVHQEHSALTRLLLEHNADVNKRNSRGATPLHAAVCVNNADIVSVLLEFHPFIDSRAEPGDVTPLAIAAFEDYTDIVEILANHGASVNIVFTDDESEFMLTPLLVAVANGNSDMVSVLLKHGAQIKTPMASVSNALLCAIQENRVQILKILLDFVLLSDKSLSPPSSSTNDESELKHNRLIDITDSSGTSILHSATELGQLEAVELLLRYGAFASLQDIDGNSPLHVATLEGHLDIMTLLLQYNANVNLLNNNWITPLWNAASQGHSVIVKKLLCYDGIVTDTCDVRGMTALIVAMENNHTDIVELLLGCPFPLQLSWHIFNDYYFLD